MKPRSALLAAALALAAAGAIAQSLALTFDDGPQLEATPLMAPAARNQALLAALGKHRVQAALFVTANFGADRAEGLALARAWGEAGHLLGNHTMSHLDLDAAGVTLEQYQREVLDCDAIIRQLPGYRRWFRFTYLREGDSAEKRDGMRRFLEAQAYRIAHVSRDSSDWRLDAELRAALGRDPGADLEPFKAAYLAQIRRSAEPSPRPADGGGAEVMLLHHNLINALWLDEAIATLKAMGWTIVTPERAFSPAAPR